MNTSTRRAAASGLKIKTKVRAGDGSDYTGHQHNASRPSAAPSGLKIKTKVRAGGLGGHQHNASRPSAAR
jgi:hypothetical protein